MKKNKQSDLSPEKYIRIKGRNLPIYKCYINEKWGAIGIAVVLVCRKHKNGNITFAVYNIDLFCRGLTDCHFFFNNSISSFSDFLLQNREDNLIEVDYALVHNIVWGGICYGEENGFKPIKKFDICQFLLEDDTEDIEFQDIKFGKDGKPFLVIEKGENPKQLIQQLNKWVGEGNYGFISAEPTDDIVDAGSPSDDFYTYKECHDENGKSIYDWTEEDYIFAYKNKKQMPTAAMHQMATTFYEKFFRQDVPAIMPYIPNVEITDEETLDHFIQNKTLKEELYNAINSDYSSVEKTISNLENFIKKNPEEFAGYLFLIDNIDGDLDSEKSIFTRNLIYKKFPQELVAKIFYAGSLIMQDKIQEFEELIDGKFSLNEFSNNKKQFVEYEVKVFYLMMYIYYLRIKDVDKAEALYLYFETSDLNFSNKMCRGLFDQLISLKNLKIILRQQELIQEEAVS